MASGAPVRGGTRRDRLARAVLVLLVLVFFREVLAGGVLFRRDIHLIWHPQIEGFVDAVANGGLPVWDPSPAFGQSLLADPQAQILYPPTWLNLVLRPWVYCSVYALGHGLLSTLCFFALARRWNLSRTAAATAALVWTGSGPFVSTVDLWHHFAGASYLPAVFLAAESAFDTHRLRNVVLLGLVFGLQILAGSADMCAMTLLALVAWIVIVRLDWRRWRSATELLARGSAALLLAAAISAGAWVAALDAVSRSSRQALPEQVRTYWSVHPAGMAELFLAGIPARLPLSPHWREVLFEGREPLLASLYLGLPCLALAGAALAFPGDRRRWALLVLGLGALVMAVGRHAPFYDLAVTALPPLGVLRYPVKAMLVVAFAWAGLAGFGVDAWFRGGCGDGSVASRWRRRVLCVLTPLVVAIVGGAFAAVLLAGRPSVAASWLSALLAPPGLAAVRGLGRELTIHAVLGAAVVLLAFLLSRSGRRASIARCAVIVAVVDLFIAHPRPNPVAPAALFRHRPELLGALGQLQAARVYSYNYGDPERPKEAPGPEVIQRLARMPGGWSVEAALALAQQMSLAPQTAGRWRLRQAYDVDYKGLQARPLAYVTRLVRVREGRPEDLLRLLRVFSVTHVIAQHPVGGDRLRLVAEIPGLFVAPSLVLSVPDTMPRARVAAGVRVADGFEALFLLVDPHFDSDRAVILPEGRSLEPPPSFRGHATIVFERADRVRIEAELSAPGFVVLADSYDPGWRARVDGRPAAVLRANLAQRAVAVSAGRHQIEMVYRPPLVLAAGVVSLVSLLAALVVLTRLR